MLEKILRGLCHIITQASTLGNMITGDSVHKSSLCVFGHTQSICLFSVLREIKMLEEYLVVLEVKIIIRKYSYLFVII
jgi:hypothetical protein